MDEALHKIQEVSTRLTMHMEMYKISESTSLRPRSVQAVPSGTQGVTQCTGFVDEDGYKSSSVNTREDASHYYGRLR